MVTMRFAGALLSYWIVPSLATAQIPRQYGFWNVNITSYNAASGYRTGDVYAEYSVIPGNINHFAWVYSPEYRNFTTTSSDPTFNASYCDQLITVHQIVVLDGVDTPLMGTGSITVKCGLGAAGRGCAGTTRVDAEPEEEE